MANADWQNYSMDSTNFYDYFSHSCFRFHYLWDNTIANPWVSKSAQWTYLFCFDWGNGWRFADWVFGYASYSLGWYDSSGIVDVYFEDLGDADAITSGLTGSITLNTSLLPSVFSYSLSTHQLGWASATWFQDVGYWTGTLCHETVHRIYLDQMGIFGSGGSPWLTEALAWYAGSMLWPMHHVDTTKGVWCVEWTISQARQRYQSLAAGRSHELSWNEYGVLYTNGGADLSFAGVGLALIGCFMHNTRNGAGAYPDTFFYTYDIVKHVMDDAPWTNSGVNWSLQTSQWNNFYNPIDVTTCDTSGWQSMWEEWHYFLWGTWWNCPNC